MSDHGRDRSGLAGDFSTTLDPRPEPASFELPEQVSLDDVPIDPSTFVLPEDDPFSLRGATEVDDPDVGFDDDGWVTETNPAPRKGWRRALWRITGGRYTPAPTPGEDRARELLRLTRRPLPGARSIAVVSTKGGVGKTTTALNLGHTLASTRGDRVVALDANPDAGSLGYRVQRETMATAADLLAIPDEITSYAQIRPYTSQADSRLEVIASPDDPRLTRRMGRQDYQRLLAMLELQYNLILADCGTGILDSATRGVVQAADQLVVVTGASVDAARAVTYMLAWLREHGMADKVERAVVVVNGVRGGQGPVDLDRIQDHFAALVRSVVTIPWDPELANGAAVSLEWLAPPTRQAYLALAATLIDEFVTQPHDTPHHDTPLSDPTSSTLHEDRSSRDGGSN
ncbi:MinD/ParA family ATP-binding protein [Euzebya tangerina]|uniref:MinD/ParA family ATP-binding protein n=1 Tax=Euzebya tangerina TaxID=591198 RepID=UPI0013C31F75|nr:MinD/ParA family protein [Euzebya tangerina]